MVYCAVFHLNTRFTFFHTVIGVMYVRIHMSELHFLSSFICTWLMENHTMGHYYGYLAPYSCIHIIIYSSFYSLNYTSALFIRICITANTVRYRWVLIRSCSIHHYIYTHIQIRSLYVLCNRSVHNHLQLCTLHQYTQCTFSILVCFRIDILYIYIYILVF